jgi:hypothetical protein
MANNSIKATGNKPLRFFAKVGCPRALFLAFSTPLRSVENAAVERELLPSALLRENQEFETDAPPGHRSTAALCFTSHIVCLDKEEVLL